MGRKGSYDVPSLSSVVDDKKSTSNGDVVGNGYEHHNDHGIHWIIAAVFIIGDMVGGGLVAMPTAMVNAGIYAGIAVTILAAIVSGYTGVQLGDNWTMLQERWVDYRSHCRKPYPEMAYRAMGKTAKHIVSACIVATQFSISVVFLLLAAHNVSSFLFAFFDLSLNFCYLIVIISVALLPLIMLESPKDFWQIAVGAMGSTSIAIILVMVGTIHDAPECTKDVPERPVSFTNFFLSYGTIIFAYGGHAAFPTIQHDMKKPAMFNRSVILAYFIIVCMYLPVCIVCYVVYGGSLKDSVIPSLQIKWIQQTVNVLITIHVFLTVVIVYSPLSQGVEDFVGIKHKFGLPRIGIRAGLMFLSMFVALSVPKFGVVLDLVGGSTITLMTMLLPSVFYLYLAAGKKKRELMLASGELKEGDVDNVRASFLEVFKYNSVTLILCNVFVLVVGVIGGVAATTAAVKELIDEHMDAPCYVQLFQGTLSFHQASVGGANCCGSNSSIITISNPAADFCSAS